MNTKMKRITNQNGLTVMELLIAIAIIGVVFTLVASFFKVSVEVYDEGHRQTEEQHAVRLATDFVTRELRNATTIEIIDTAPDSGSPEEFYIYVSNNNKLVKYVTDTDTETTYTIGDLDDVAYNFAVSGSFLTVEFSSRVEASDPAFELETEVLLNNVSNAPDDSGKYLGYSK